ncbi:MAG TPA: hypothetical protein VIK73_04555 [Limnochordales bacterium]
MARPQRRLPVDAGPGPVHEGVRLVASQRPPTGMPDVVRPMLAELAPSPFDSPRHLFEPKWDGLRAIAFVTPDDAWLQSRRVRRWRRTFPEVIQALRKLAGGRPVVLDGELIVPDPSGRPDFEAALARSRMGEQAAHLAASQRPAVYVAFDLLYLDGEDLRASPLRDRRERLQAWAAGWPPQATVILCPATVGSGRALFESALRLGFEGAVAKDLDSPYLEGRRSRHWLKLKPYKEEAMWVVGYVPAEPGGIRALAVASPPDRLTGLVGTGLSSAEQRRLRASLDPLARSSPPPGLALPSPAARLPREAAGIVWTPPVRQVRVRYLERTSAGWLRHASVVSLLP